MISNDAVQVAGARSWAAIFFLSTYFVGSVGSAAPSGMPPAPLLISATPRGGMQAPRVMTGFSDSSFDYGKNFAPENKTFCYIGDRRGVCPLLLSAALRMQERYREGAHDTIIPEECRIEVGFRDVIRMRYRLTDDYGGDLKVDRRIPPCEMAEENPGPVRTGATPL